MHNSVVSEAVVAPYYIQTGLLGARARFTLRDEGRTIAIGKVALRARGGGAMLGPAWR